MWVKGRRKENKDKKTEEKRKNAEGKDLDFDKITKTDWAQWLTPVIPVL